MRFYHQTALLVAATTLAAGLPAMAQDTQVAQSKSTAVTRTTVPGHVSTNKRRVVHIKKHVTVPASPAPKPGDTVHKTTTTTMVHKSSAASSGPAQ
jgi:hypothetical protein